MPIVRSSHLSVLLVVSTMAAAQSPIPTAPVDGTVTSEQIEAAIEAVEVREGLDEETQATVVDLLRDAKVQIANKASAEAAARAFAEALESAPLETARLRQALDDEATSEPSEADFGITADMPLAELERVLALEVAELAVADTRLSDVETRIRTQEERPAIARERINELRVILDRLSTLIASEPPPAEPAVLTDARKISSETRLAARNAELNRLDQELLSHSVRLELLRAKRDVASRKALEDRRRVEFLRSLVNNRRQASVEEAQAAAAEAELAAADKHPALRTIAEGNAALSAELPGVAADIERIAGQRAEVEAQLQTIESRLQRSRQRLAVGGVTQAIGRIMVEERRNLPKVAQFRAEVRARGRLVASIGLAQVHVEEQRRDLASLDAIVNETMADIVDDVPDPETLTAIREEARELFRNRRDLLNQAASTYSSYLRELGDLDVAQRRLLQSADEFRTFLDQNLLWIPSTTVLNWGTIVDLGDATARLLSPRSWLDTGGVLYEALRQHPAETVFALLLIGGLVLGRRPMSRKFRDIDHKLGRLSTDSIWLTLYAIGLSAVRALPLPLALAFIGWALSRSPSGTAFSATVGAALLTIGPFLYNLLLFRVLCAREGVARRHFGWQEDNLVVIRRQLDRLIVIGTPVVAVAVLAFNSPVAAHRDSLGRIAFITLMLVFAIVLKPLGDPRKSVAATYFAKQPNAWASRLKWLWYGIEVGGPVLLAGLAIIGYFYTAAILTGRFIDTIWLVLTIVVANLVVLRWLALAKRKLQWQMALEEREARRAEKDKAEDDDDGNEAPVVEEQPLDLDAVDQQSRRLFQAGIFLLGVIAAWGIWSEVLPALNILDEISLWTHQVTVDGVDTLSPVTLADVLLAMFVAAVTLVASRNLPGLMEIAVLQHIELEPGSRYTINSLLRYAVFTIGVITVFSIIGWNWSRIQWLVAALSVGLGFGLQEIVANFVSGLIILFERPVRVGDTVTVGTLDGTVTKVRIRATTIRDWDRKEIIVPNKAFITEQVINWTLTDPITRVVVPVGISYGSDVRLATQVMQDTLNSMPLVLDEPEPRVFFMGFGDSSLDFKLFVFSRELGDRLPLMHAVHQEILEALREHGIEIPFPQRDLHVRSVDDDAEFGLRR